MPNLNWNEIKTRAIEFSKEWENEKSEDAEAKSFWDSFFNVFGMTRRRLASFEVEVQKRGGSKGYIDLFWPGMLLVEHKSLGLSLEKAHTQAMDYFPGIEEKDLPRYVLVSDFGHFKFYDLDDDVQVEFPLNELSQNIHLFGFIAGYKKQEYKEEDVVNIKAAELMGKLYDSMVEAGYEGHELNILLVRILFCLFADDANIFLPHQFQNYIQYRTHEDGSDFGMHLGMLFQVLNTPKDKRQSTLDEELSEFEYVNGGLFAEPINMPSFNSQMRKRLLDASHFDWSKISPAIFGSLFQSVMDKDARRHLGAHYTSEKNILKLIRPLFIDDLKKELKSCGNNVQRLNEFWEKIAHLKFLDPACGCGNFLVIAFRELRLLELELLKKRFGNVLGKIINVDVDFFIKVKPEQFFGIEIEEFPAKIAETAMWLMNHQMNELASQEFGKNFPDLPLGKGATVFIGNALRKDWEEIVPKNELSYILGNPPFIGKQFRNQEQNGDMNLVFGKLKGVGVLDYVSGWYIRAARYIQGTKIKCAFVSTNSINQGEQVGILWNELFRYGIKINFAHRTFKWSNEASGKATVHVVIIGFANFDTEEKYLYEYENVKGEAHEIVVKNINPYLVPADDIVILSREKPICNVPNIVFGSMPNDGGNLLLSKEEKNKYIKDEPDGGKLIKYFLGAEEFINNIERFCFWLKGISPAEIRNLPILMSKIRKVKEYRLASKRETTRKLANFPTLFGEIRQPESDYIAIPEVSSEKRKYIPIGFIDRKIIASNRLKIIPEAKLYHFGILTSQMHMAWTNHVCGRLESRITYSNSIVYNNYPWPENPSKEKIRTIEEAAKKVLETRKKFPNSSLADLYDPLTMPTDLVKAHQNLDNAVDSAYGRRNFETSADRMNFLFALYKKYTSPIMVAKAKKQKKSRK